MLQAVQTRTADHGFRRTRRGPLWGLPCSRGSRNCFINPLVAAELLRLEVRDAGCEREGREGPRGQQNPPTNTAHRGSVRSLCNAGMKRRTRQTVHGGARYEERGPKRAGDMPPSPGWETVAAICMFTSISLASEI